MRPRILAAAMAVAFVAAPLLAEPVDIKLNRSRDRFNLGLSDFSLFVGRPLRDPLFGSAPAEVIIGAQNDFVLGFLDKHLRGVTNDFPTGPLARYEGWVLPTPNADLPAWWNAKPEAERATIEARIKTLKPTYAPRPDLLTEAGQ